MTFPISLIGLASNDPVPGVYVQTNFAAGPASSGSTTYSALLMGNMTSAGNATKDTVVYGPSTPVPLTSVADAISLFGDGSELTRMIKRFMAVNTSTPLFALAISEGNSAVASTGTITITSAATGSATLRVFVEDEWVDTGIVTGDTAAAIATNAIANINGKTSWAVTASSGGSGVITLTSKNKGLRANWLRYFAKILPFGVGSTVTPAASTLMSGGSVSDVNTTALSTIVGSRYYYIVDASDGYDVVSVDSNLSALVSQVQTQALPVNGRRQRVFAGNADTLANAIAVSTSLNSERCELVWSQNSDVTPGELAANQAAIVSLEEGQAVPRANFASYGQTPSSSANWKLKAPLSGSAPTRAQLFSALNSGVSPIGVGAGGSSFLVKRVTTRFLNGSNVDYRIREAGKVTIEDFFADDLLLAVQAAMDGKLIGDDPVKGQPQPAPNVATPRVLKAIVNRMLRLYFDKGLIQAINDTIANSIVQREASPTTRLSAVIPLQPSDPWDQAAVRIDQIA